MMKQAKHITQQKLCFGAWLLANDMLWDTGYTYYPVEGVDLDFEKYEIDGCGFNLMETVENHKMRELIPLLSGVGI